MARSLGVGGATGLGSIVYALTVMSKCLRDDELLADAHVAADLFTDDLIAADKELDVIGGSAGADTLPASALSRWTIGRSTPLRRQVWGTSHRPSSTGTDEPSQLGRTSLGAKGIKRHVPRRRRICLCARFIIGSHRTRGIRAGGSGMYRI